MAAPMRIAVTLAVAGCVSCPSANADSTFGPGTYAVPAQVPYGIYTATADPNDFGHACSFSTWTNEWKFLNGDNATPNKTLVAVIQAPLVANFITHGCTRWTKVHD